MNGGGTRRWGWGGGRAENLRTEAQAAKDAAAAAFYALDTAQREVRISVETISAVENSAAARRTVEEFAQLCTRIDHASHEYITAVDAHDLDRDDLDSGTASRARAELARAREDLDRVKAELDRFSQGLGTLLTQAENQLARVAPAVERARQGLLAASESLDRVRGSGLRADDHAARLAALSPELTKLNEGAGQHGVHETVRRADRVVREAGAIRSEVERLPETAAELDKRLSSLRTRAQALHTRAEQCEPVLSELRRRFSLACWEDLQQVPREAGESVRQAEERLREAREAREQQRWADTTALLSTTRALLDGTDEAVKAVTERLRRLDEVAADHTAEVERARFAVRDAQRLAMAGRSTPDPRHAGPLDSAVERVRRAVDSLTGRHPDYWHLLSELDAVRETAQRVVDQIRQDRAGGG
ncbi:hypothetical protein [Streptomyces sp. AJS327]|uniref:hypothetical protein n=1 Tax=Streptomyces sp. AJS327 TaxID=2545265 RepID=UPI0015DE7803|nr:hypothetical protein [Streptomyces sp. AJS327]